MVTHNENHHVITGQEAKLDGKPAYSSAVVAGDTIYLAGATSGRDAAGSVVGRGDIEAQTIAVFESLKRTLATAGATFSDLTKITVLATKLEYLGEDRGGPLALPSAATAREHVPCRERPRRPGLPRRDRRDRRDEREALAIAR